jgi:hypothetical protein
MDFLPARLKVGFFHSTPAISQVIGKKVRARFLKLV